MNCIWREDPDSPVGNRVLWITPNVVLPGVAVKPGFPKLAWLKISKTSHRNCARRFSRIVVFFRTEKSTSLKPGPVSEFLPMLPKCTTRLPLTKLTGTAKVDPAGQLFGSVGSQIELLNHWVGFLII